jgi:hypothetical protein
VDRWITLIGLDPSAYGTHSMRRTKVSLLYKKTGNLRACQLLLGRLVTERPHDRWSAVDAAAIAIYLALGA